jgi:hypothetical protein
MRSPSDSRCEGIFLADKPSAVASGANHRAMTAQALAETADDSHPRQRQRNGQIAGRDK